MRRALAPSRSETRLDNLMWASSSKASSRFCNWTRFRVCWYLARVTARHRRCWESGTTLGVGEIVLAPPPRAVRLRLRQVQGSGHGRGTFPLLADRLPVPFQGSPDRFPVQGRRFHDHFFHLLFEQPVGQQAQLGGVAAKLAPLKDVLAVDFDVGDDHGQHPLMNINSCYLVRHTLLLLAGAESVPSVDLNRVAGYRRSHRGDNDAQLFAQRARSGSDRPTASTSPLLLRPRRSGPLLSYLGAIFMRFRGPQALHDRPENAR